MADRVIKIITAADNYDLMTLDELKALMGILPADTSQDAMLQGYITGYSDVIATLCKRTFAYEEVSEIWRCTNYDDNNGMKRLFLSHYPVAEGDVVAIESPTGTPLDPGTYVLEEKSGKIELLGGSTEPIMVHYSGGYKLPDEAPPALKAALELTIRQAQAMLQRLGAGGIRSITHKEARVQFYDPLGDARQSPWWHPRRQPADRRVADVLCAL